MEDLELVLPAIKYAKSIADYKKDLIDNNAHHIGAMNLSKYKRIYEWIDYCDYSLKLSEALDDIIPFTQYMLIRKSDDEVVGMINIRHGLKYYEGDEVGDISYGIKPSEQGKGYGHEILRLALLKCIQMGYEETYFIVSEFNDKSIRVIENSGGIFDGDIILGKNRINLKRYRVRL